MVMLSLALAPLSKLDTKSGAALGCAGANVSMLKLKAGLARLWLPAASM